MKILLVLGKYLPEKNGGIENYSHWLATILLQNEHSVDVAILNSDDMKPYNYEDVTVVPLTKGFDSFSAMLKEKHYDICHFHEYSAFGGIELFWFKEAKQYCKKIFFTFHLPYFTCYKGDFRYMGIRDCDNFSNAERCVKCIIATKLNYQRSGNLNLHNIGIDLLTPFLKKTGKIKILKANIQSRKNQLNELINTCDNIFIYGAWFKRILFKNGYDSPVIKEISHISKTTLKRKKEIDFNVKKRIVFVGRIEKQKGLHLLCKAMNLVSHACIQVDVFGNIVDENYYKNCYEEYKFNYKGSVPRTELLQKFIEYDFLILPSVFTEMYSLVLKEAYYEELPVIVSSAKGNKDVVKENITGFVFEYNNYKDLARMIDRAYELKEFGWKPVFDENSLAANENREILSYYC